MEKDPGLKELMERSNQNLEQEDEIRTLKYYLDKRFKNTDHTEEKLAELMEKDVTSVSNYVTGKTSRPKSYKDALRLVIALKLKAIEAGTFLNDIGHPYTAGNQNNKNRKIAYRCLLENPLRFSSVTQFNIFMNGLGLEGI